MGKPVFRIEQGSIHERFLASTQKIQIFGGGFANGKTSSAVVKGLRLAQVYPGMSVAVLRATFPKLNDTIKKEFLKWCPGEWIKSHNKTDNNIELRNGTTFHFRYVKQTGGQGVDKTSNLLSATYDLIIIDQADDPEITYKDFLDLLGRLRGSAEYTGTDKNMPKSGPRWIIMTSNPTSNWIYSKLIKPLHMHMQGYKHPDLIVDKDGKALIELFEGSTYENKINLGEDYIALLEATYKGNMRDRFLLGQWGAYEGLVYPQFNTATHVLRHEEVAEYLRDIRFSHKLTWTQGYDHGIVVPACYLLGFTDNKNNTIFIDGFYEKEKTIEWLAREIQVIQRRWGCSSNVVRADPAVFRRGKDSIGATVADEFAKMKVNLIRGNNDIISGIMKNAGYLHLQAFHKNPITDQFGAPHLYISDKLTFLSDEFSTYRWMKDHDGTALDRPVDKDDHAMDALKYAMTDRPKVAAILSRFTNKTPDWMHWHEREQLQSGDKNPHRHKAA